MVGVGEFHEFDGRAVFDDEGYADAGAFRSGQWSEIRDQWSGIRGQWSLCLFGEPRRGSDGTML